MLHHIFSDMAGAEDAIRCINCMEEEGYISNPLKLPCKDMTCSGIHCEKCLSKKITDGKIACISCRCVLVCACYINVFIKQLGSVSVVNDYNYKKNFVNKFNRQHRNRCSLRYYCFQLLAKVGKDVKGTWI